MNEKNPPRPNLEIRNRTIASILEHRKELIRLDQLACQESYTVADDAHMDKITEELDQLHETYRKWLPTQRITRCPICGDVVELSIDSAGLDGLWWYVHSPVRRVEERHPHVLAFNGAVALNTEIETSELLARPGPQVPFIAPRILNDDSVLAVISSLSIGKHDAYAIYYFADPLPIGLELVNDWGSKHYDAPVDEADDVGSPYFGRGEAFDNADDYDFELRNWIERGKLKWIAPNDSELRLRETTDDCPYLDLPGLRRIMRVKDGRAWSD